MKKTTALKLFAVCALVIGAAASGIRGGMEVDSERPSRYQHRSYQPPRQSYTRSSYSYSPYRHNPAPALSSPSRSSSTSRSSSSRASPAPTPPPATSTPSRSSSSSSSSRSSSSTASTSSSSSSSRSTPRLNRAVEGRKILKKQEDEEKEKKARREFAEAVRREEQEEKKSQEEVNRRELTAHEHLSAIQEADRSGVSVGSVTTREGLGENVPYPGSEFIGMGYDALVGNPNGDEDSVKDPGFRAPVLRFGYCQSDDCLTRDMVHLRPMKSNWDSNPSYWPVAWARPEASCERSKRARMLFTTSDYAKSLSVDAEVSAEAGFFGGSAEFSASAGMDQFTQEVENTGSQKFSMKSYCILYSLGFAHEAENTTTMWDQGFKEEFDRLPIPMRASILYKNCAEPQKCYSDAQLEKWITFFKTFGTHYVYDVKLGGKFVVDVTVKEDSSDIQAIANTRASVEASFDGFGGSASASLNTASSKESREALENKSKDVSISVLGGTPPSDAEDVLSSEAFGEWAATVADNPMPVQYKLAPISTAEKFRVAAKLYGKKLGKPLVQSDMVRRPYRSPSSFLFVGEKLHPSQALEDGTRARLTLTEAGNLEEYYNRVLVWESKSKCAKDICSPDTYLAIGKNCKLAIYEDGKPIWESNNRHCVAPAVLKLHESKGPFLYDSKGTWHWHTNTESRRPSLNNPKGTPP